MSKLVIHETRRLDENEVIDISLWEVPIAKDNPDGVSYSLNYRIYDKNDRQWKYIIRYDNAHKYKNHKTRHHRHIGDNITEVKFQDLGSLYEELLKLIDKLKSDGKNK